jgi:stress-induced morphogen
LQRFPATRLHTGAMRHEVGAAGLTDRGDLFLCRLLRGRLFKPTAQHQSGHNHSYRHAGLLDLHRFPPTVVGAKVPDRTASVQRALYCRIAYALRRGASLLMQTGGEAANHGGAGMAMAASDIERLIRASIPDASVTIRDLAGDGDHYAATVIAESFRGKSRVQQHKIVYDALKGEMGGKLHALALQTGTPER